MMIGPLGASGAVSAYGYQPYVYNNNTVNAASLNKLSKISDDVLDKKIDYSELADESRNSNPLKKGQTLDFQSMLAMQMQRGQYNAARVMRQTEQTQETGKETEQDTEAVVARFDTESAQADRMAESMEPQVMAGAEGGNGNVSYQMQQALNAYGMFMTA